MCWLRILGAIVFIMCVAGDGIGKPLTDEDFNNGDKLTAEQLRGGSGNHKDISKQGKLEGDIIPDKKKKGGSTKDTDGIMRNGIITDDYLHRWADGLVPYTIDSTFTQEERAVIAASFKDFHTRTCIKFIPQTTAHTDYVHIVKKDGCWSSLGRVGEKQELSLGDGCVTKATVIHEALHALGVIHEHNRADRDKYVTVKMENVQDNFKFALEKYPTDKTVKSGLPYDYQSVMHYHAYAFSKNDEPTMVSLTAGAELGQEIGFSELDIKKINLLYKCPFSGAVTKSGTTTTKAVSMGSVPISTSAQGSASEATTDRTTGTDDCEDETEECKQLSDDGGCTRPQVFARCPESCGMCGEYSTTATVSYT